MHHKIYQYDSMAMRSTKEFRLVLIPAWGWRRSSRSPRPSLRGGGLLTANCGWLVLAESGVYVMLYELSHLAYHLPEDSFIGRSRWSSSCASTTAGTTTRR